MSQPIIEQLRRVEVLVLDVDGVLTDGRVTYSDDGKELQSFHARDGSGMAIWKRAGKRSAVITGRGCKALERRAAELGIDTVLQHVKNKKTALCEVVTHFQVEAIQVAVVGDDVPDLPMLRLAGVKFAVADACAEVRQLADEITRTPGGFGAVREVVERILKAQDRWAELITA